MPVSFGAALATCHRALPQRRTGVAPVSDFRWPLKRNGKMKTGATPILRVRLPPPLKDVYPLPVEKADTVLIKML